MMVLWTAYGFLWFSCLMILFLSDGLLFEWWFACLVMIILSGCGLFDSYDFWFLEVLVQCKLSCLMTVFLSEAVFSMLYQTSVSDGRLLISWPFSRLMVCFSSDELLVQWLSSRLIIVFLSHRSLLVWWQSPCLMVCFLSDTNFFLFDISLLV